MSKRREIVVGGFVAAGLAVTAAVIFMIGNDRRAFASKVMFQATFKDVQGLKGGAPVRMGGIDIGVVKGVEHGSNPSDDKLYVTLEIVQSEAVRIRDDALVRVANKGMLGDKMLELAPGTPGHDAAKPGSMLASTDDTDFSNILTKATEVADKTQKVLANIEKTSSTFAEEGVRKDMAEGLHSMTIILGAVAQSEGYAGKFVRSPEEAEKISRALGNIERSTAKFERTLDNVNMILDRINRGPGLAHEVLYSEKGADTVARFGDVASEMALTLKGVRESNGIAHGILYGDPAQEQIMNNLVAMSSDLKFIVGNVKAGKGTVGAFLNDPSVYEDVKSVLGNVERNDVLRALVRYSIKQDEKKPSVTVTPPESSKTPAPPTASKP